MTLSLSPEKTGVWALHEVLTSAQVNKIASELVKAVDGVGGGIYTVSIGDLEFTGTKKVILDLAAQLTAGKTLTVDGLISVSSTGAISLLGSGSSMAVHSGAAINLTSGAAIALAAGASISLASTATIAATAGAQLTGELDVPSGSIVKFARAQDLQLATESFTRRSFMVPFMANPTQWVPTAGPVPTWVQHNNLSSTPIFFPIHGLLPGDVITAVAVNLTGTGGHSGLPAALPVLSLVSVAGGGIMSTLCSTQDSGLTLPQYEAAHVLVLNSGSLTSGAMPTVGVDPIYLEVSGEGSTNAIADALQLLSINTVGTRTKIANSHDFG